MPTAKKKSAFFNDAEQEEITEKLRQMAKDTGYNTDPSYSTDNTLYPDNLIPFVEKHLAYLKTHPATDPRHYMANLRLMTRIR